MPGPDQLHAPAPVTRLEARPSLDLGPAIVAADDASRRHEWLLTNGRGGYACGSIAGTLDRRYHAVLCAATRPPDTRSVVVAKFDERLVGFWTPDREAIVDREPEDDPADHDCTLSSDVWSSSGLSGFGHRHLIRCRLIDGAVEHVWLVARTRISRRLVMPHGHDAIVAEYRIEATDRAVRLAVKAVGGHRLADFLTPGATWRPTVTDDDATSHGLSLPSPIPGGAALPVALRIAGGRLEDAAGGAALPWYRGYRLDTEAARGYDAVDDHLLLGEVRAELAEGDVLRIEIACGDSVAFDFRNRDVFAEEADRRRHLLTRAAADAADADPLLPVLVEAADRFIVSRPIEGGTGASIIAGYPWFADWGRDTMIALPGLCLATGRAEVAREILRTYAGFERDGMLPNRFPGLGHEPEYNTADAALLFIEAIGRTWQASRLAPHGVSDADAFLRSVLPTIDAILEAHRAGTRHGIRIDPADGLLEQGEDGLQLTWMDARIGGKVVTPRAGKAVELNGLLHSAFRWRAIFATHFGEDDRGAAASADRIRASFEKFWMPAHGYLADVIDGPHDFDGSLRPNQLLATGCAHPPVVGERASSVLAICDRELRTPFGLRTLGPGDDRYQPRYHGDQASRDAAYHMGTSWPWLLGPFLRTHWRVHHDLDALRSLLAPFVHEVGRRGLGGIAEVHDGTAPHAPGGCLSQAWSIAEILCGLRIVQSLAQDQDPTPLA
jgi:predicted glycogen debranching enzyme